MERIRAFCFVLVALAVPAGAFAQSPQPADRSDDHVALRALLVKGAEALNSRNLDAMVPRLHPGFTIITVDNQKLVGIDAFKKYYLGLFDGPNALLSKLETRLTADDVTGFLDANVGIVYGTSQDTFHFKDGDVRTMQTRWSAVTQKEADGWKIVNVHFSTNVLDNPLLEAAKSYAMKMALGGAVIGLIAGTALMALIRRRPRT